MPINTTKRTGLGRPLSESEIDANFQQLDDLSSTATDDGTKGFHLVSYPVTSEETSAGVTPVNYEYPPCHPNRYGTNTTPGTTDMSAAIQSVVDVVEEYGRGTVNLDPDGKNPLYAHSSTINITGDNITVLGGGAKMIATADCYTWSIGGQSSFATSLTYYDITGTYSVGDKSITLATPAEHSNFAVGNFIYIRCQQEIVAATDQPVAEINYITAIDTGTGVISLKWPLSKDFVDDAAYPYGVAVADSIISENIKVFGGTYENSYRRAFNSQHVVNHEIANTTITGRGAMVTRGRFIKIHDNDIDLTPDWSAPIWRPYFCAYDTGTSDAAFYNNQCRASDTAFVHMHEGLGNCQCYDNDFFLPVTDSASAELFATVSITGQSWNTLISRNRFFNTPDNYTIRAFQNSVYSTGHRNLLITDNEIHGTVTAGDGPGTAIRTDLYCDGKIHGNRVMATVGGNSIQVDNALVTVRNNEVTAGTASLNSSLTEEDVTGNKGIHLSKIYISASEFDALAGTPALTAFATARGVCWALDAASAESVSVTRKVPPQATNAVVKIHTTNLGTGVGFVKWNVNYAGFSAGEDTDVANTTVSVTTTGALTQDYLAVLTLTSFSVVGGDALRVSVERDAADAGDTLGNDAGFIGAEITFT